jgi:hypothetical protein
MPASGSGGAQMLRLAPLSEDHPLYRQQKLCLGSHAPCLDFELPTARQGGLDHGLMRALRARVLNSHDAYFTSPPDHGEEEVQGQGVQDRISVQNEREALQLARRLICEQFPDSREGSAAASALRAVTRAAAHLCAPGLGSRVQGLEARARARV